MTHDKLLVLGGTGFIGRCVIDHLVARGCSVRVATRRRARARELLVLPTVEVVEADVHDAQALRRLVAGRDAVINLVVVLTGSSWSLIGGAPG